MLAVPVIFFITKSTYEMSEYNDIEIFNLIDNDENIGSTRKFGSQLGELVLITTLSRFDENEISNLINNQQCLYKDLNYDEFFSFRGAFRDPNNYNTVAVVVMFPEGGILSDHLNREKSYGLGFKTRVALDIAQAVRIMHSNEILHNDLRPCKLAFNSDWKCKVLDLLSAIKVQDIFTPEIHTIEGDKRYQAPELLLENYCSGASDVFSFGLVLYEILTSLPSWQVLRDPTTLCVDIEKMLRQLPTETSTSMRELLINCLKEEPEQRPTMEDVSEWLSSLTEEISREGEPPLPALPPLPFPESRTLHDSRGSTSNGFPGFGTSSLNSVNEAIELENSDESFGRFRITNNFTPQDMEENKRSSMRVKRSSIKSNALKLLAIGNDLSSGGAFAMNSVSIDSSNHTRSFESYNGNDDPKPFSNSIQGYKSTSTNTPSPKLSPSTSLSPSPGDSTHNFSKKDSRSTTNVPFTSSTSPSSDSPPPAITINSYQGERIFMNGASWEPIIGSRSDVEQQMMMRGYLGKKVKSMPLFRKKYFFISGVHLTWCASEEDCRSKHTSNNEKERIDLTSCSLEETNAALSTFTLKYSDNGNKKKSTSRLSWSGGGGDGSKDNNAFELRLKADNVTIANQWRAAISFAINSHRCRMCRGVVVLSSEQEKMLTSKKLSALFCSIQCVRYMIAVHGSGMIVSSTGEHSQISNVSNEKDDRKAVADKTPPPPLITSALTQAVEMLNITAGTFNSGATTDCSMSSTTQEEAVEELSDLPGSVEEWLSGLALEKLIRLFLEKQYSDILHIMAVGLDNDDFDFLGISEIDTRIILLKNCKSMKKTFYSRTGLNIKDTLPREQAGIFLELDNLFE